MGKGTGSFGTRRNKTYAVCQVRTPQLPPPEEPLRRLCLSCCSQEDIQLECEGHSSKDYWNRTHEVSPPCAPQIQDQLQRRHSSCTKEEGSSCICLRVMYFFCYHLESNRQPLSLGATFRQPFTSLAT
ncbi:hypothetical protein CDL12_28564 [Handroanthus impetiginosus]|uniref:Uncharacterized protein n=1 Tax=Handroanthus impetiginosus TaxID=429701 RepID=A0A2G9G0U2_9LAMI|nr:hypothetical protein CDL12_28564 [Handroanthus impetiginosus]